MLKIGRGICSERVCKRFTSLFSVWMVWLDQLFFTPDSLDRSPPTACCNALLVAAIWLATQDSKHTCCHTPAAPSSTSTPSRQHCKTKPNQTKPNDRQKKRKKNHRRKKKRECLAMKKNFALSRSLSLSLSLARDPRKRGAVSASPVSRAPPANRNKEDNGRAGALGRNRNGKERKNQPRKLNGDPNEWIWMNFVPKKNIQKLLGCPHVGSRYVGTSYVPTTYMDGWTSNIPSLKGVHSSLCFIYFICLRLCGP